MNDPREPRQAEAGLCPTCLHAHVIVNDRGSRFVLCRLSRVDPRYPRYPRLPVLECSGYVQRSSGGQEIS